MSEVKNGDMWGRQLVQYVRRHWPVLTAIFAMAIWVSDVNGSTKDRYTGTEAAKDKAEIELLIHESVKAIEIDMAVIKAEQKALRELYETLDPD